MATKPPTRWNTLNGSKCHQVGRSCKFHIQMAVHSRPADRDVATIGSCASWYSNSTAATKSICLTSINMNMFMGEKRLPVPEFKYPRVGFLPQKCGECQNVPHGTPKHPLEITWLAGISAMASSMNFPFQALEWPIFADFPVAISDFPPWGMQNMPKDDS